MADITKQDMVLHRTERTTGGRMGAIQITGGDTDYLFPPVTTIARATGKVDFRGAYAFIKNDGIGVLGDSFAFVAAPPADGDVSVALMSRGAWGDDVGDWKTYITSYLAPGAPLSMWPYGSAIIPGSEVIMLWGRTGGTKPQVGKTYILRGYPGANNQIEQAITISDVQFRTEVFADEQGEFTKELITLYLEKAINYTFPFVAVTRYNPQSPSAVLTETNPSSGVRIYGISKVAEAINIGDQRIKIDSPSVQVIPAALDEANVVDQTAANTSTILVPAASGLIEFTYLDDLAPGASIYLGSASVPGTVEILAGPSTLAESGGQLKSGSTVVATVDSTAGVVTAIPSGPTYTAPLTVRYQPAGPLESPLMSGEIKISQANQGRKYVYHLSPPPRPGTVIISYMSGGSWYALYDQGDGSVIGTDESYGRAQITGGETAAVTIGYAPDVGSSLIFQWGVSVYTSDRSGVSVFPAAFLITATQGFSAGDTITWNDGLDDRTATIGSDYSLSGDATGAAYPGAKQILLRPAILPPTGTLATVHLVPRAAASDSFTGSATGTFKAFALSHGDVLAGSVRVAVKGATRYAYYQTYNTTDAAWRDDGVGSLTGLTGATVDYVDGEVVLPLEITLVTPTAVWGWDTESGQYVQTGYQAASADFHIGATTEVVITYQYGDAGAATTETHALSAALVDILPNSQDALVPGSLRATLAGKQITDSAGALYADRSTTLGTGVWVGSADYASRRLTFTQWEDGETNAFTVQALTSRYGQQAVASAVFRTPTAPVKPSSLSVRAVRLDGTEISATADGSGAVEDDGIEGTIAVDMGIVRLRFGEWVAAAGNEGEDWYRPGDVVLGQIFKPIPVLADSITYDCVTLSRAVLADTVIGLDTARVPGGRVDHIRKGDVVMVHETGELEVSTPVAGAAVTLPWVLLERVWCKDSTGAEVPAALTETGGELDVGVVHWVDPLPSTTTYPTPWTVYYRKSDLGTANFVSRFGDLSIRAASGAGGGSGMAHAYSTAAYVSSLLYMGNIGVVDAPEPWAQALWGGVWADSLIGNPADRAYDYLTCPIVLNNRGSTLKAGVALVFESDGLHYRCYIEGIGIIDTGISIADDYAPINPTTNVPYFTIRGNNGGDEPWGAVAWPYLSCLRFQLQPSTYPIQAIRCVQPSPPSGLSDRAIIEFGGGL